MRAPGGQHAPVSDSPDSLSERSRAIFERLRALDEARAQRTDGEPPAEEPPAEEPPTEEPGTSDVDEPPAAEVDEQAPEPEEPVPAPEPAAEVEPQPVAPAPEHVEPALDDAPTANQVEPAPVVEEPSPVTGEAAPVDDFTLPGAADLPPMEATEAAIPGPEDLPDPDDAGAEEPEELLSTFRRPLPRILAIANQKGGVGKTTTAVNLGACLADLGYRVLVVDLDPQGNASTGLGINIRDLQGSMYDVVLHDLPIEDCVEATSVRNLFVAPSSLDLAGAEIELVPAFSREMRLKRALEDVRDDYDFVLIDCPPSLGLLTVNGLAAATEVVVPIQCEYYALEGLGQLLRNVNLVQKNLNPALELTAIVLVMHDARTKLADQVVREVRAHFGAKVCRNVVPRTVRLSEAPSFGQPIIAFDPSSRGAVAYRELAKEVSGGAPQRLG